MCQRTVLCRSASVVLAAVVVLATTNLGIAQAADTSPPKSTSRMRSPRRIASPSAGRMQATERCWTSAGRLADGVDLRQSGDAELPAARLQAARRRIVEHSSHAADRRQPLARSRWTRLEACCRRWKTSMKTRRLRRLEVDWRNSGHAPSALRSPTATRSRTNLSWAAIRSLGREPSVGRSPRNTSATTSWPAGTIGPIACCFSAGRRRLSLRPTAFRPGPRKHDSRLEPEAGREGQGWIVRPYCGYAADPPELRKHDWAKEMEQGKKEWRDLLGRASR